DTQFQLHLNWSGAYGHSQADNGSILLFAFGRELLSDIGYTHTRYRNWTLNTASHNTVVVDERSQTFGSKEEPTTGRLLYFDDSNPHVRYADVDASPAYPDCGVYRRRLLHVHAGEGRDYVVDVFDVEGGKTHDWFLHGSADEEGVFESPVAFDTPVDTLIPEWGGRHEPQNETQLDLKGAKFHAYQFLWNIRSAPAPKDAAATWHYENAGLRTHLFAEPDSTLFHFQSPAVRGAKEVDADLPNHLRHGILLRHAGPRSRYVAVHEPFATEPWVQSVTRDGNTLTVQHAGGTDTITLDADRATVTSTAGWTYDTGTPYSGALSGVQRADGFALIADKPLPDVPYVRIAFGDAKTLVYPVEKVEANRLLLKDDPGFEYADGKARFLYFPQEEFDEPAMYTV
ncbi:MAG: heparinase II/III family protein, partial [FCB group bacterium]|nr:heparinase II/III family protein [FCB group bacterium]